MEKDPLDKKLVDEAKEVLMRIKGLNEPAAFRMIQKKSMDSRVPMRKIAEAVLDAEKTGASIPL